MRSRERNLETKVKTVKQRLNFWTERQKGGRGRVCKNFSTDFRMRRRDQQKLSNEKNESMKAFFCSSPSARFFSLRVKRARKL